MIQLKCAVDDETLQELHKASRAFNVPGINKLKNSVRKRPERAILCAAGNSLFEFLPYINSLKGDVFSLKTTDVLLANGIQPRFEVHVDSKPTEANYVSGAPNITYLLSTLSHADVYEAVGKSKCYEFDAALSSTWKPNKRCITAGTNVAAHTMFLAAYLGYKYIDVFGFDCSYSLTDKTSHVNKMSKEPKIHLKTDGREFMTTETMVGMAQEAVAIMTKLTTKAHVGVYGNGLVQFLTTVAQKQVREMKDADRGIDFNGIEFPDASKLGIT
jgi:hypothetical protein